jgi:hypothetical protein
MPPQLQLTARAHVPSSNCNCLRFVCVTSKRDTHTHTRAHSFQHTCTHAKTHTCTFLPPHLHACQNTHVHIPSTCTHAKTKTTCTATTTPALCRPCWPHCPASPGSKLHALQHLPATSAIRWCTVQGRQHSSGMLCCPDTSCCAAEHVPMSKAIQYPKPPQCPKPPPGWPLGGYVYQCTHTHTHDSASYCNAVHTGERRICPHPHVDQPGPCLCPMRHKPT